MPRTKAAAVHAAHVDSLRVAGIEAGRRARRSRCYVCSHPSRDEAERMLLGGASYGKTLKALPDLEVSVHALRHHTEHHLPPSQSFIRLAIQESAERAGRDVEDDEGFLGDYVVLAKVGIQRVVERMVAGTLEPDVKDAIALAKLLRELESEGNEILDHAMIAQAFVVWTQIIRETTSPEQFQEIGRRINVDPVLAAFNKSVANRQLDA